MKFGHVDAGTLDTAQQHFPFKKIGGVEDGYARPFFTLVLADVKVAVAVHVKPAGIDYAAAAADGDQGEILGIEDGYPAVGADGVYLVGKTVVKDVIGMTQGKALVVHAHDGHELDRDEILGPEHSPEAQQNRGGNQDSSREFPRRAHPRTSLTCGRCP